MMLSKDIISHQLRRFSCSRAPDPSGPPPLRTSPKTPKSRFLAPKTRKNPKKPEKTPIFRKFRKFRKPRKPRKNPVFLQNRLQAHTRQRQNLPNFVPNCPFIR